MGYSTECQNAISKLYVDDDDDDVVFDMVGRRQQRESVSLSLSGGEKKKRHERYDANDKNVVWKKE